MDRPDRLSALVSRFALDVQPTPCPEANLVVVEHRDGPVRLRVLFAPSGDAVSASRTALCEGARTVFSARASLGGAGNPLTRALPPLIELPIDADTEMQSLVNLLVTESREGRCGAGSVVNRLGEVLLVRLLRALLSAGSTDTGLLAGLADPRLCHAIVAIHERPGHAWRIDDLAAEAGLSTSRFATRFVELVGQSPMSYLRHWRMVLARQDIERGDRVQTVAGRYGYASTEALSRAFRKHYGHNPLAVRGALPQVSV